MKKKIIIIASIVIACIIACVCDYAASRGAEGNEKPISSQNESNEASKSTAAENLNTSTAVNGQGSTANTKTNPSSSQSQAQSETKKVPGSTSQTSATTTSTTEKQTENENKSRIVTVTISCRNALGYDDITVPQSGYFVNAQTFEFTDGDTVYAALSSICEKNNLSLVTKGNYITSIGGLSERDCTRASGWVYTVNGQLANKPMKKQVLQNGDKIEIYFVTNSTDKA